MLRSIAALMYCKIKYFDFIAILTNFLKLKDTVLINFLELKETVVHPIAYSSKVLN